MHIDILPNRKSHPTILLRESYRGADGRPKKPTLHNLTNALSLEQAYHWRALLQGAPVADRPLSDLFEVSWALPHGHLAAILHTMDDLKLPDLIARSDSPQRRMALALIAGRLHRPRLQTGLEPPSQRSGLHFGPGTGPGPGGAEPGL